MKKNIKILIKNPNKIYLFAKLDNNMILRINKNDFWQLTFCWISQNARIHRRMAK